MAAGSDIYDAERERFAASARELPLQQVAAARA
jgi:hypothetical protein